MEVALPLVEHSTMTVTYRTWSEVHSWVMRHHTVFSQPWTGKRSHKCVWAWNMATVQYCIRLIKILAYPVRWCLPTVAQPWHLTYCVVYVYSLGISLEVSYRALPCESMKKKKNNVGVSGSVIWSSLSSNYLSILFPVSFQQRTFF